MMAQTHATKPARRFHMRPSTEPRMPPRLRLLQMAVAAVAVVLVLRLGYLQVVQHGFYEALASGQRDLFQELFPERGDLLVMDRGEAIPIATNQYLNLVWADTRIVDDPVRTARVLHEILPMDDVEESSSNDMTSDDASDLQQQK